MDASSFNDTAQFEGFRLDRGRGTLFRKDESGAFAPLPIGSRALDILGLLIERPGELVSRTEIFSRIWPDTAVEDSNLNVQIAALRRVLDAGREESSCIQTVPGRGYRFVGPVTHVVSSGLPPPRRPSGNGAGDTFSALSQSGSRPCAIAPPQRKWLCCAGLGLVAGAIGLLAAVLMAANWPSRRFEIAHPAPRMSVVVLPFTNLGDDRDGSELANGLTEDLTTELSLHSDIRVSSPYSAFAYGNKLVETRRIGRELAVRYALEGSVQRSGARLRVDTQLIDTERDTQLWAAQLDRAADDLFALQSEIASQLANTLVWQIVAAEAARANRTPDALGYILRGRAARLKPNSPEVYAEAIDLFEHALALDPQSYQAQTWVAASLASRVLDRMTDSPAADIAYAEGLIDQVLARSPRYARAHFVKGQLLRAQHRWPEATPEFEKVLAIFPNDSDTLHALGDCKLFTGSIDQVIPLDEQAIRLDPRDPHIGAKYWRIGLVHLLQSRTDQAILALERAARDEPGFSFTRAALASAYALNGETGRANAELAEARRLAGGKGYSTMAHIQTFGVPKIRALNEATYFAGLRKAGMSEE